jgi:hypothetical protein
MAHRWSRSTGVTKCRSLHPVARKRGSLLLIAFLVAVMASGGGGVTAPWIPRSPDLRTVPLALAHIGPLGGSAVWRFPRMV